MSQDSRSPGWTRREALGILGMGAAAAMLPEFASAADLTFPAGAVIRCVLRDYKPEELAGGVTLFHEHISFKDDFMTRWNQYAADTRRENAPPAGMRPVVPAGAGAGGAGARGGGAAAAGGARGAGAAAGGRGAAAGGAAAAGAGRAAGAGAGAARGAAPGTPSGKFFMQDLDYMTEELERAKKEGIGCIVDGGHPDMGRDPQFLKTLSQKSGMPIVLGGGFYTQPFYPKEITTMSEEQIVRALVKQVEDDPIGVFGEIGSWDEISADERKVFRSIGKAHLQTNLSIFTHTGIPGKSAMEQLDLLEDAGVKPNRICIGHLGNLTPQAGGDPTLAVHRAICKRGAFIGFDRQGGAGDAQQVPMVMALLDAGYADNLLFSADIASIGSMEQAGGQGYAKTWTVFVPKLKEAGASEAVLHQIMYDNPRRFLAFVPKIKRKY
jgi:phosphotriesterase-related protein